MCQAYNVNLEGNPKDVFCTIHLSSQYLFVSMQSNAVRGFYFLSSITVIHIVAWNTFDLALTLEAVFVLV